MAHDGDLCSAVLGEFIRSLFSDLRRRARRIGVRAPETGAVTCIQRFSSHLATNVHFHTLVPDGVFTADRDGTATFHPLAPPTPADIERVAGRARHRVVHLLRRLGRLPAEDAAGEEPDTLALAEPALAWCLAASVAGRVAVGPRTGRPLDRDGVPGADWTQTDANPWCAQVDGFNLHAGVAVKSGDRDRLEHLCRYMARPAIAQDRLTLTADGRVAYRLERPWRDGTTHVFFEPLGSIAHLVGLIPAPGRNLTRYHGVFAPNAKLRPAVVPPPTTPPCDAAPRRPPSAQYVTWAALMQRVFGIDVLRCTKCGGTWRLIAFIHSPKVAAAILASQSAPRTATPPRAPP
jgi:hypothetical protein